MAATEELTTSDASRWREILPIGKSVFGSVEFARIQEAHRGATARLLAVTSRNTTIALPYFARPVAELPFADASFADLWDAATPEYTGPLHPGSARTSDVGFAQEFTMHCQRRGIITEFAHLHPWNADPHALPTEHVFFDRRIVYADLSQSEEQLWRESLKASCRRHINRAVSEGLTVRVGTSADDVGELHRVYTLTMDRVEAHPRYRFDLGYFRAFTDEMPDNAHTLIAEYNGRVVAAMLVLHDDTDSYFYLGGADLEFGSLRPSNLLYYEAMLRSKALGKLRFVLGGGHRPQDGVLRFKGTFSPLRADFSVTRRIHLDEAYAALCRGWAAFYGRPITKARFFPAYRKVPTEDAATHSNG